MRHFYQGGSVRKFIQRHQAIAIATMKTLIASVVVAMAYCAGLAFSSPVAQLCADWPVWAQFIAVFVVCVGFLSVVGPITERLQRAVENLELDADVVRRQALNKRNVLRLRREDTPWHALVMAQKAVSDDRGSAHTQWADIKPYYRISAGRQNYVN